MVLALFILLLIAPLMLVVALCVRASSPGPVIFRQRRYGLYGDEIVVYKFRSMTVSEDGGEVRQARARDARLTSIGAFLRRTSLDELPQFWNVLQGRMSIVGPRPHAVAHNEQYRKLIKGYMLRHKVKPGITGWAQVNGMRGETATLDKMQARVRYDLDYLRGWSLWLDLWIIVKNHQSGYHTTKRALIRDYVHRTPKFGAHRRCIKQSGHDPPTIKEHLPAHGRCQPANFDHGNELMTASQSCMHAAGRPGLVGLAIVRTLRLRFPPARSDVGVLVAGRLRTKAGHDARDRRWPASTVSKSPCCN